jgi:hypothetical protein
LRENLQWYHHKLGRKHYIIIPSDIYRQSESLDQRTLVSLMESLLANGRISLWSPRVQFEYLPKNMRRRFSDLPKDTLFEFYYVTEEQWFDLLQSLEADEILTSKKTSTQDFVISTLEHHQVQKNTDVTNSSLSLRQNVITDKEVKNEKLDEKASKAKDLGNNIAKKVAEKKKILEEMTEKKKFSEKDGNYLAKKKIAKKKSLIKKDLERGKDKKITTEDSNNNAAKEFPAKEKQPKIITKRVRR